MNLIIPLLAAHVAFGLFEAGAASWSITPNPLLPLTGGVGPTEPATIKVLPSRASVYFRERVPTRGGSMEQWARAASRLRLARETKA